MDSSAAAETFGRLALNQPLSIDVTTGAAGEPVRILRQGWPQALVVDSIQDCWRIDDEWWRDRPVSRLYYVLLLTGGMRLTVFHDLTQDVWFEQHAGQARAAQTRPARPGSRTRIWLRTAPYVQLG